MKDLFDVVVLGGGPCGLAAATALSIRGRSVGVFERLHFGGPRAGETFGPEITSPLREIGVIDEFLALEKIPFRGVQSAWGSAELIDRPSIVHPLGEGFHVDRAQFDVLLARRATAAGAALHDEMGVGKLEWSETVWRLSWPNSAQTKARFILDASGRGAPAGAKGVAGRQWVACDRAVGVVTRLSPPSGCEFAPELLIETAEIGWWYVALQPGPALLCVLLTDADLIAVDHREQLPRRWQDALAATKHVKDLCTDARIADGPRIVRADTGFLWPNRGHAWCAIGDALFATDPLSGDGVLRGLSNAVATARIIDEMLDDPQKFALPSIPSFDPKIPSYLDQRLRYYQMEQRWSEALFWKRRHAIDWHAAPIALDPRVVLRTVQADPDSHALAPLESLVPPRVLRATLERCAQPTPAHEVLGRMRTVAPLGDRRLLVVLQELVSCGMLAVDMRFGV